MHFARLIITPFAASRKLFVDAPGALLLTLIQRGYRQCTRNRSQNHAEPHR